MSVVYTEKRVRTPFGKFVKWTFVGFNAIMFFWLISYFQAVSQIATPTDAAKVGAAIGATMATSMILAIWAFGDIILGVAVLLTRGDKVITEHSGGYSKSIDDRDSGEAWQNGAIERALQERAKAMSQPAPKSFSSAPGFGKRMA